MKAIFLDVDGVLNNEKHIVALYDLLGDKLAHRLRNWYGQTILDYKCCELIKKLIKATNAKVVLSSTWRLGTKDCGIVEDELEQELYGITPYLGKIRGEEISLYLKEHPEIKNYVIIDDDKDMLKEQLPHFCFVDRKVGFVEKNYKECLEILKNEKLNSNN